MTPTTDRPRTLWELTRLAEFEPPAVLAQEAAAKGLRALRRLLFRRSADGEAPARAEADLSRLAEASLERLAPPIDWVAAVGELDDRIAELLVPEGPRGAPGFLVGPPHGGHGPILRHWAETNGWTVVEPPPAEQILAHDDGCLADWPSPEVGGWVLPELARWFLRHADGLAIARRLLELADSGRLGRGVVGCDSWAWAFLQKVWPGPQPRAFVLKAVDGEAMGRYFSRRLRDAAGRPLALRHARSGEEILSGEEPGAQEGKAKARPELERLAARSRGHLGIACAFWRAQLLTEPDPEADGDAADTTPDAKPKEARRDPDRPDAAATVWWAAEPVVISVPEDPAPDIGFLLHALLLHGGLPAELLPRLLPPSPTPISAVLGRLRQAGVIEASGERWRVTALAYPEVRELLRARGFLTDAL